MTVLFSRPLYYAWRLLLHVIDVVRYGLRRPLVIDVFDSGRIALVSCCSVPNVQGFFAWPPSNPAGPMPSGEGSGARQIQADMPPISPRACSRAGNHLTISAIELSAIPGGKQRYEERGALSRRLHSSRKNSGPSCFPLCDGSFKDCRSVAICLQKLP